MAKESYARGTVRPLFCKARNVSEAFPVVAAAIIVKPVDVSAAACVFTRNGRISTRAKVN